MTQEQTIREEFMNIPHMKSNDVVDFFINKLNTALEEQKKELVEKLEEMYVKKPKGREETLSEELHGLAVNYALEKAIEIIQSHK